MGELVIITCAAIGDDHTASRFSSVAASKEPPQGARMNCARME
jgi:hypothetical protein